MTHRLLQGEGKQAARDEAEALAGQHSAFRFAPYPGRSSAFIVDTMQTVLHHYLGAESFTECLVQTVNQGGDADTAGALAGMLAGATYGSAAIPARWRDRLDREVTATIRAQAPKLLAIARGIKQ